MPTNTPNPKFIEGYKCLNITVVKLMLVIRQKCSSTEIYSDLGTNFDTQ